jgi:hypothetical protein
VQICLATLNNRLAIYQEPGSAVQWLNATVEAVSAATPAVNLVVTVGGTPYRFVGVTPAVLPAGVTTPTDPNQQFWCHGHYR